MRLAPPAYTERSYAGAMRTILLALCAVGCVAETESHGVTAKDNRLFVEAVLYRYRTGIPWRDLPDRFGCGVKVHTRFSRWAKAGVWERVFQHLAVDADNEYAMIDATIVRAHQHAAGAPKKLGLTRRSGAARAG